MDPILSYAGMPFVGILVGKLVLPADRLALHHLAGQGCDHAAPHGLKRAFEPGIMASAVRGPYLPISYDYLPCRHPRFHGPQIDPGQRPLTPWHDAGNTGLNGNTPMPASPLRQSNPGAPP